MKLPATCLGLGIASSANTDHTAAGAGSAARDAVDAERLRSPTFITARERITSAYGRATTSRRRTHDRGGELRAFAGVRRHCRQVALQASPRLTALIFTADILALSAMDYLRAQDLRARAIAGFDGCWKRWPRADHGRASGLRERGRATIAEAARSRTAVIRVQSAASGHTAIIGVGRLLGAVLIADRSRTAGPTACAASVARRLVG